MLTSSLTKYACIVSYFNKYAVFLDVEWCSSNYLENTYIIKTCALKLLLSTNVFFGMPQDLFSIHEAVITFVFGYIY
jgi:hypothetical protein